ncbi:nucleotidyltransferase domain-containing protein [Actinoplanes friuliensis]|uniref:Polymerase nucleotidyl transferase domain-containing protein n=1 Tax=Actinoplanes friuliensis DSM 7358 TaxID=1246995 RepID=U5W9A7_9ACTN|nr:nucleotidyltransferase domain-containing protein [Actinoplanes friuliensis]AGZ44545.1 hypothetical protein AFR_31425 [Actinoplanes friuliensis DSM 7358]
MNPFDDLVTRATADPGVRGLVLTGSYARGLETIHSDHDVIVVMDEESRGRWETRRSAVLDEIIYTVDGLADTSLLWQRYAFRGARVLLDRLDGRIAELVELQAEPTADEAREWGREALDGVVNQFYRAAKSRREGALVAARLDEMESVSWLLTTIFSLHGRLRPYNKYLRWELDNFPLGPPWDDLPERVAADPGSLFKVVCGLAERCGHRDVLDSWGDSLDVVRATYG